MASAQEKVQETAIQTAIRKQEQTQETALALSYALLYSSQQSILRVGENIKSQRTSYVVAESASALKNSYSRGIKHPDPSIHKLYAHLSNPRGTPSLFLYWWSILTGVEGHSHKAPLVTRNYCLKCFLRSSFNFVYNPPA
jgi:hypothetical protein